MASVKLKFRPSSVAGNEGTLFYKVTHNRVVRQINTKFKIYPYEWNDAHGSIIIPQSYPSRKACLEQTLKQTQKDIERIQDIIKGLDNSGSEYKTDDIVKSFGIADGDGFLAYARKLIAMLKAAHVPVADKYQSALNKFIKFHGNTEISFREITPALMIEMESWMKTTLAKNATSFYMRNLHAIYNRAMEDGLVPEGNNPFHRVYTGVDKTQKRAITAEQVKKIKDYDLSDNPKMAFARDIFLLSFYLRGISIIDMAFLEKDNLKDGFLKYKRRKTSHQLSIKWLPTMAEIVNRYGPHCTGNYLLPILSTTDIVAARQMYKNEARKINLQLMKLGNLLDLPIKLTTYVSRHSWATTALSKKVSVSTISRCLGHDSEKTTQIYLASIDTSEMDDANEIVIESLL